MNKLKWAQDPMTGISKGLAPLVTARGITTLLFFHLIILYELLKSFLSKQKASVFESKSEY